MMSLKERIAARKAAEGGQTVAPAEASPPSEIVSPLAAMGLDTQSTPAETKIVYQYESVLSDPVPVEVPVVSQKPMTFAERIAAKKKLAEASAPAPAAPIQTSISMVPAMPKEIKLTEAQLAVIQEEENSELAQAYSDVALMVNKLQYALDGEPLANAMSDLKKALKQNASACMLLLDSDIGQMTLALRRLTGTELAEATKEKKTPGTKGKKASSVTLTPEEIALALATDF